MPELFLEDDGVRQQWVEPDPSGFTLRTRYKDTQRVLESVQAEHQDARAPVNTKGAAWQPVCRFPIELYEQLRLEMGRDPSAEELIALSQTAEYSLLRLSDKRFR